MPEIILHYIWKKGLFLPFDQFTTDHRRVEVKSTGHHNMDAGPDFTDVHLLIDGVELVGQVEIHVDSRDWYYHHHDLDPAYDSIILHIVSKASQPIYNTTGQLIPQLELNYNRDLDYINDLLTDALEMDSAESVYRCAQYLMNEPEKMLPDWKETMLHRRLECKSESVKRLLHITHNDWRQAFYISIAHGFGFHVNGVPMELLALSTPLSVLAKHRDHIEQLAAILLGQAGLLKETESLWKEYMFLRQKYTLEPIDATLWKQGRIRPHNRPRVRILQLAQLVQKSEGLLRLCLDTQDVKALHRLFAPSEMGKDSVNSLLINVVAPFLYARGQKQKAIQLLRDIPQEDNRIIRRWQAIGQKVNSAADTQALLHLFQTYCEQGLCLRCSVWSEINSE